MTVWEANCQVKFSVWPASGTAVTNQISANSPAYDASIAVNEEWTAPSSATTQIQANTTDYIKVPKGAVINNLGDLTIEWLINYTALTSYDRFFSKETGNGEFAVERYADHLYIKRMDTAGVAFKAWNSPSGSLTTGLNFIQISWQASSVSSTPILKINNVAQTLTYTGSGSTTAWQNDSLYDLYIGNSATNNRYIKGTFYLFRLHNTNLSSANLTDNYLNDIWRVAHTTVATTVNWPDELDSTESWNDEADNIVDWPDTTQGIE